jgi:hypothetical protein
MDGIAGGIGAARRQSASVGAGDHVLPLLETDRAFQWACAKDAPNNSCYQLGGLRSLMVQFH